MGFQKQGGRAEVKNGDGLCKGRKMGTNAVLAFKEEGLLRLSS